MALCAFADLSREAPDLNFNDEHYLIRASRRKLRD